MLYATDTVGRVVIDVIHLTAVILAGLVYDIRGLGKCVGKVLGSMDRILLSDHGSLKLYLPGALEFLILKGKVERAVLQLLQETVKDRFTGGSGRAGGMTENQGVEGPAPVGCIRLRRFQRDLQSDNQYPGSWHLYWCSSVPYKYVRLP